jgi:hypothetical protein
MNEDQARERLTKVPKGGNWQQHKQDTTGNENRASGAIRTMRGFWGVRAFTRWAGSGSPELLAITTLTPFLTDEMQPRLPKQLTTMQQAEEEDQLIFASRQP